MPVVTSVDDAIATLRIENGRMNAVDPALITDLRAALEQASPCRAVVLTGQPGIFTAGLDVKALARMTAQQRLDFFVDFGRLILELWVLPVPVVCAATGHAIAAGTLLALASDHVVAARGDYRWGMTETRIGLELSDYAIMLVRRRVGSQHADKLLLEGFSVDPDAAVRLGIVDESADPDAVVARATCVVGELAALPPDAYARNKARLRSAAARSALADLPADIARLISSDPADGASDG
ncbi:MAG: enoyl-CoA hydratase [Pseudonocardiales bacterium]|nr:enoyl-CoA hydratase [Pseudonocardiales bacterium]